MTSDPTSAAPAEPSGERFVPEAMGGQLIEAEHQARYRFATQYVAGRTVLDAGCGVGWGSAVLLDAGAAEVTGLDISEEALADARNRAPSVRFVLGDLLELGLPDAGFDVVVCFEALEHTSDTDRALDELVRVLAPGGVLLVSSPNPDVYPAGNPFHLHELRPEELEAAVRSRLPSVGLFRQHQYLSSVLLPDATTDTEFVVRSHVVGPVGPGHDQYSVAVASTTPQAEPDLWQSLAPSDQLDDLARLSSALGEEREHLQAHAAALTAEVSELHERLREAGRSLEGLTAARDAQESRLRDADRAAREVLAEREDLHRRLSEADVALRGVMTERDDAHQAVADLTSRVTALQAQLAGQSAFADNAARERDELGMRLLAREQAAAGRPSDRERLEIGLRRIEALEAELNAVQRTTSWRVTRPLRAIRTAAGRADAPR